MHTHTHTHTNTHLGNTNICEMTRYCEGNDKSNSLLNIFPQWSKQPTQKQQLVKERITARSLPPSHSKHPQTMLSNTVAKLFREQEGLHSAV